MLYISRGAIPTTKSLEFVSAKKQICIYAFPRQALENFANADEKTPLEEVEDIEILRFLELGYEVQMIEVLANSIAVDVPDDVQRVEKIINA